MVEVPFSASQAFNLGHDPKFVNLQQEVSNIAESVQVLVERSVAPAAPAVAACTGAVSGDSGGPSTFSQGSVHGIASDELSAAILRFSGDESEEGDVDHKSVVLESGPDTWFLPEPGWQPFWDKDGRVAGFMTGNQVVPGSREFKMTNTGIRWRYSQSRPLVPLEESTSERTKSLRAFKSISALWFKRLDGVKVTFPDLGASNWKERWVRITLPEDSFLLEVSFWDSKGSWKDFLEGRKLRWPSVNRFINEFLQSGIEQVTFMLTCTQIGH